MYLAEPLLISADVPMSERVQWDLRTLERPSVLIVAGSFPGQGSLISGLFFSVVHGRLTSPPLI